MLATSLDLTTKFNANNGIQVDVGQWQNIVIGISGTITGTVNIKGTNDGGAIEGSTQSNPTAALNFTTLQATDLSVGTAVTAITTAGNYRISNPPQYISIGGASAATTGKIILFLTTPV